MCWHAGVLCECGCGCGVLRGLVLWMYGVYMGIMVIIKAMRDVNVVASLKKVTAAG